MTPRVRVLVWNLMWRRPGSEVGQAISDTLRARDPDLMVLTEVGGGFVDGGFALAGSQDWEYPAPPWRRKVQLWSKQPWTEVDRLGSRELPGGRYVAATTATPLGLVRLIGVCIPWRDAHVRTGRKDRRPWEDHLGYLQGLRGILDAVGPAQRCVVAGDWNQKIPRNGQPKRVFAALQDARPDRFTVPTEGVLSDLGAQVIDHVAITEHFSVGSIQGIPRVDSDARRITDHFGVVVDLADRPPNRAPRASSSAHDRSSSTMRVGLRDSPFPAAEFMTRPTQDG